MPQLTLVQPKISSDEELNIAHQIIWSLEQNNLNNTILLLDRLSEGRMFPQPWIQATKYALKNEDWSVLSEGFIRKEFIGTDGYFLLIAPHQLSYEEGGVIKLSAILGKVMPIDCVPLKDIEEQVLNVFGKLLQPITEIIPFTCIFACSRFYSEDSEAFIVPESWMIPGSLEGPVINNLARHRQRFHQVVRRNIPRIFEPETANLLLDSLADETIGSQRQHIEYQYHDAGHATGLGIKRKIQDKLLSTYWFAGIEEWRADSVEFDLAIRTMPNAEVGKLIAANLCLRFGIDAQRWGGYDYDTHATSSLFNLEYLFRSSAMHIKKDKLALRNPDYQSLVKAIEMQRAEAVSITREELFLEHPTGILGCYHSIKVHQSTKEIFRKFIVGASKDTLEN
ncbi:hypothetical protein H6G93_09510 [Nostoc sp. FACHB-973]|nr:hypothetical protein [Nostoc sp. FACHB-973]